MIVGSFFISSAVHVAGVSQRYGQAYNNPEVGGASHYKLRVWVPAGTGMAKYVVLYEGNKFKDVSTPETSTAHWATLGVFPSAGDADMTVRRVGEPGLRNNGSVNGKIMHRQVEWIAVS